MAPDLKEVLTSLQALDFTDRGEAFVEAKFLTPLLACLGYEHHKDYEVIRHGDGGSSFKLQYPPVEKGAQRVKYYNPDYAPTIRKKMFWIIEAKSAKYVTHPFEVKYLVQGLQYCVHPEIQAKYLLLSNGKYSSIYDAHGSVFFGKVIYEPIFEFESTELTHRWNDIFELLSVERLRERIETDLKAMYDKLCLSSLDDTYPQKLLRDIGAAAGHNARQIEEHVRALYLEGLDQDRYQWEQEMERLSADQIFELMGELPLRAGPKSEGHYFVNKSLEAGMSAQAVFEKLTGSFDRQRMFRKLQSWFALCLLYHRTEDESVHMGCRAFFDRYKDAELPMLSQVECAYLRLTRKIAVISLYPALRQRLQHELASAPEIIRFVRPPTAHSRTYALELAENRRTFTVVMALSDVQLKAELERLLPIEAALENDFRTARAQLSDSETEIGGFETYGLGGKHYGFKNILINCNLEPRQ